jgi:hypothetical protein
MNMSKFMRGGPPRSKTQTPTVQTSLEITGQGTIPYAKTLNAPVESAPKGEMTVRGYGLQLRATKFVLR